MVRGLDLFRDYFKDYTDKYILIGGTACDLAMASMGLNFRATKDLDIVLILEALDVEFVNAFWAFIKKGQYKNRQKSTGKKLFYRFYDPETEAFPYMIELFSRKPDVFELPIESHLTPIPIDETVSSLSAILMDSDYYDFIKNGMNFQELRDSRSKIYGICGSFTWNIMTTRNSNHWLEKLAGVRIWPLPLPIRRSLWCE